MIGFKNDAFKVVSVGSLASLWLLTACVPPEGNDKQIYGTAGGALAGAALGTAIAGEEHRAEGAVIGGTAGAIVGAAIGRRFDEQEAELRRSLQGSGVGIQRTAPDQILLNLPGDITFATDSSAIEGQFYGTLNNLAASVRNYPDLFLQIVGHTDNRGTFEYNQGLSERRASSVANYLAQQGVRYQRISVSGRSFTEPVASNNTPAGRRANRRVEIVILPGRDSRAVSSAVPVGSVNPYLTPQPYPTATATSATGSNTGLSDASQENYHGGYINPNR